MAQLHLWMNLTLPDASAAWSPHGLLGVGSRGEVTENQLQVRDVITPSLLEWAGFEPRTLGDMGPKP